MYDYRMAIDIICTRDTIPDCMFCILGLMEHIGGNPNVKEILENLYARIFCKPEPFLNPESSSNHYFILDGHEAVMEYVKLTIPGMTTPEETICDLQNYARNNSFYFSRSETKPINKNEIEAILNYLENKYSFVTKMFADRIMGFLILDALHYKLDGFYGVFESSKEVLHRIMIGTLPRENDGATPEFIVFHELAHALHTKLTGSVKIIPEALIDLLKETHPEWESLDADIKSETFADTLACGLMHGSPYANHEAMNPGCELQIKQSVITMTQKALEML